MNATTPGYSQYYRMFDYVVSELPQIMESNFGVDNSKKSIFGHSMGGHGALICALKVPNAYRSVSAFSPICNPVRKKVFPCAMLLMLVRYNATGERRLLLVI